MNINCCHRPDCLDVSCPGRPTLQPVVTHDELSLTATEWHRKPKAKPTVFGWILLVLAVIGFVITIYRFH